MLIIAGHLVIAGGERDRYLDGCRDVVAAAREAPGCLDFALAADLLDPDRITVYERWDAEADLERFRGSGADDEQLDVIVDAEVSRYTVAEVGPP